MHNRRHCTKYLVITTNEPFKVTQGHQVLVTIENRYAISYYSK